MKLTWTGPLLWNQDSVVRGTLGGLCAFGAINAFGGGLFGMLGADGVPREWLAGSPFTDYFVPSLVLFLIVGGCLLAASLALLAGHRHERDLAFLAGVVVTAWIAMQVTFMGYVSWLQPVTGLCGLWIVLMARFLPEPASH